MIPNYQEVMLPLLKEIGDGREYFIRDIAEKLTIKFNLTEEEKKEKLPSGSQGIFLSRVGWAKTYLKKAGLLISPKKGTVLITDIGKKVLQENLTKLDNNYLKKFDSFVNFYGRGISNNSEKTIFIPKETVNDEITPEENLDNSYNEIRNALSEELLEKILNMTPDFFEKLVVDLLVKMGYGGSIEDAGKAIGKTGDEGIDGIIKEDKLGLDMIYVQAKRWKKESTVGRPDIQRFVGALAGQGAKKGVFITTCKFSSDAKNYIPKNDTKVALIDGEELANLMIDYNLGCATEQVYEIKKIDNDYFDEE